MLRHLLAAIIAAISLTGIVCAPAIAATTDIAAVTVQRFRFQDHTVFSDADLESVVRPWCGQHLGLAELLAVRSAITEHYRQAGYLTSFAFLPADRNQQLNADAATITIQIVEGTIAHIEAVNPTPFTQAIAQRLPAQQVFNQHRLLTQLQFLRLAPGIRDVQAELLPGDAPGHNRLQLNIRAAPRFELAATMQHQNSAATGSITQGLNLKWEQPLGLGDRLTGTFNQAQGRDQWGWHYSIAPDPRAKIQFGVDYQQNNQRVLQPPFEAINIRAQSTALNLNLDQVVLQQADRHTLRTGKIGATLSFINSRSSILDRPFPLTLESNDQGQLRFSVLRCFQAYQQRSARSALAMRSQFNLGLPWGSTTGANGVDGKFFTWQGQAQLNQSMPWSEFTLHLTGQLSGDALPRYEQLTPDTMPGYKSDFRRGQSGFRLGSELRIPLQRSRDRGLFLTPSAAFGVLWHPDTTSQTLASGGLGLEWLTPSGFSAQVHYDIPFIPHPTQSWPDSQFNFSVQFKSSF
jgi:hemolysin activation/secretion protein